MKFALFQLDKFALVRIPSSPHTVSFVDLLVKIYFIIELFVRMHSKIQKFVSKSPCVAFTNCQILHLF